MKKAYSKPQILFDDFELAQDIAAGCEAIANHAMNQCAWNDPFTGVSVFVKSIDACDITPQENDPEVSPYDSLCYHVPSETYNLFTS